MVRLLLIDTALMMVVFAAMWILCLRLRNYGFLDVTWTFAIGLLAVIDALSGDGWPVRRLLFTGLGLIWSLRLGSFILARVLKHHPSEDKRYRTLRERWPGPGAFLAFFELQGLIAAVFSLPFLVAARATEPSLARCEWIGLGLAAVGIAGEAVADAQAQAFKRQGQSRGRILDQGLWRYSRHPNYFFEWLVWVGFAVAAWPLPAGGYALLCPLLMGYFLLRVTGIPLTEQHSIETHGDAYRDYQRRTSAFVPWPRRA